MSSPFQAAPDRPAPPVRPSGVEAIVQECLELTLAAFSRAALANETELARVRLVFERSAAEGQPIDALELLARIRGVPDEHLGIEIARLGQAVAQVIHPAPPLIPFAGRLISPSAFYERFEPLHQLARALLAPVIYAEDTDAIGTGALNPIAARLMAEEILATVDRRLSIKPFVTAVRMDYDGWLHLTRKQFSR